MVRNVQGHLSIAGTTKRNNGAVDCVFETCSRCYCFVIGLFVIIFIMCDC